MTGGARSSVAHGAQKCCLDIVECDRRPASDCLDATLRRRFRVRRWKATRVRRGCGYSSSSARCDYRTTVCVIHRCNRGHVTAHAITREADVFTEIFISTVDAYSHRSLTAATASSRHSHTMRKGCYAPPRLRVDEIVAGLSLALIAAIAATAAGM